MVVSSCVHKRKKNNGSNFTTRLLELLKILWNFIPIYIICMSKKLFWRDIVPVLFSESFDNALEFVILKATSKKWQYLEYLRTISAVYQIYSIRYKSVRSQKFLRKSVQYSSTASEWDRSYSRLFVMINRILSFPYQSTRVQSKIHQKCCTLNIFISILYIPPMFPPINQMFSRVKDSNPSLKFFLKINPAIKGGMKLILWIIL